MKNVLIVSTVFLLGFTAIPSHAADPLLKQDYEKYFASFETIYLQDYGYRTFRPEERQFREDHDELGQRVRQDFFQLGDADRHHILDTLYKVLVDMDRTVWQQRWFAAYPTEYRAELLSLYLELSLPLASSSQEFLERVREAAALRNLTRAVFFQMGPPADFTPALSEQLDHFFLMKPSKDDVLELLYLLEDNWSLEFSQVMLPRATSPAEFISYLPHQARRAEGSYRLQLDALILDHMETFLTYEPSVGQLRALFRSAHMMIHAHKGQNSAVLVVTEAVLKNARTAGEFIQILRAASQRSADRHPHLEPLFLRNIDLFVRFNPSSSQVAQAVRWVYPANSPARAAAVEEVERRRAQVHASYRLARCEDLLLVTY